MLSLERAITSGATLLLLDEPSSGLDVRAAGSMKTELSRLASQGNISIVIAEHNIGWPISMCENFVALKEGKIYRTGSRDLLKINDEIIRGVFL